ncbi:hypothetical protein TgHK011_006051 [Trichoderma gracile]|nr:hypothetical protein TgHK011_006051 [Trichoderma gracile]
MRTVARGALDVVSHPEGKEHVEGQAAVRQTLLKRDARWKTAAGLSKKSRASARVVWLGSKTGETSRAENGTGQAAERGRDAAQSQAPDTARLGDSLSRGAQCARGCRGMGERRGLGVVVGGWRLRVEGV